MQCDGLEIETVKNDQFFELLIEVLIEGGDRVDVAAVFVVPAGADEMQ